MDINLIRETVEKHGTEPMHIILANPDTTERMHNCTLRNLSKQEGGGLEAIMRGFPFGEHKATILQRFMDKIRLLGVLPTDCGKTEYGKAEQLLISSARTGYVLTSYESEDPIYYYLEGVVDAPLEREAVHMTSALLSDPLESEEYENMSDVDKISYYLRTSILLRELWLDTAIISPGNMFEEGVYSANMLKSYFGVVMPKTDNIDAGSNSHSHLKVVR